MQSRPRGGASSRASTGRTPPHEVKVKHIITREVSTDEASFKDVVQRFTGKDSAAARAELLRACDDSSIARMTAPVVAAGGSSRNSDGVEGSGGAGVNTDTAVSFQETVLPSLEEMDRWWGSHDIYSYAERP